MPEASIVITAQDRYSSAIKSMSQITRSFSKDQDEMQKKLNSLRENQHDLQKALKESGTRLKELEKQCAATGNEADEMARKTEQANFDTIKRNLALVTKGASMAEQQMQRTGEAFRKTSTAAGGMAGLKNSVGAVIKAGAGQMLAQAAQQAGNTLIGSAFSTDTGAALSSAISGAISGAAIGNVMPGIGTAVGAAIGGAAGLITGGAQVFGKKDDAFKSHVQTAVEGAVSQRESDIASGSAIAAGRETDRISFSTLFKSRDTAEKYLGDLVDMANTTPFLYDDLTAMSKTLATYGYGADSIMPVLQTVGDAGAALGMTTSDMSMTATALGRMKSSNKTTMEYLSILNDRGIGAVGMLSDAYGVDQGAMYDMISEGKVAGAEAVEIILRSLTDSYSGAMERQSETFAGRSSTLEGLNQEMQYAYGEGYNNTRNPGLTDQIDYLSGASGDQMKMANKAIGAWYASLENQKEQLIRDAQQEVLNSADYWEAIGAGTDEGYAEAGRMLMEAKIKAQNEYNASEGAALLRESELTLAEHVRDDTASNEAFWDAGYRKGEQFSKGLAASWADGLPGTLNSLAGSASGSVWTSESGKTYDFTGYAYGLDYVPRDNFPALLHQGERVMTAEQARAADRGGSGGVTVNLYGMTVREDADIERVAEAVERRWKRRQFLSVPQ